MDDTVFLSLDHVEAKQSSSVSQLKRENKSLGAESHELRTKIREEPMDPVTGIKGGPNDGACELKIA